MQATHTRRLSAMLVSVAAVFACAGAAGAAQQDEMTVELIGGDGCPGHVGSGFAPWVLDTRGAMVSVYADSLDVLVHRAAAGVVKVDVSAARWQADKATVYRHAQTVRLARGNNMLQLPLLDSSVNHITIAAENAPAESAYRFEVVACPVFAGPPPVVFKQAAEKSVSQAELDAKLREIIRAAGQVSAELGGFLRTNVIFWDGDNTQTGVIGASSSTMRNTRIRISRRQWREALLEIKCAATEAERRRLEEHHFRQFLSQILHEATHRRGLVGGTTARGTHRESREEKRTTDELVLRMIDLLERLKTAIEATDPTSISLGDGGGLRGEDLRRWFERLRTVIERQKAYRWQWLGNIPPWREKAARLQSRLGPLCAGAGRDPQQQ